MHLWYSGSTINACIYGVHNNFSLWSIYHLSYGPNWALMWLSWVRLGESVTYLDHGVILNFWPKWTNVIFAQNIQHFVQGSQYCTGGCTGLASGTIYFGYWLIPVYRFGFTAIFYYFIPYTKL